jgi:hypothetical protein
MHDMNDSDLFVREFLKEKPEYIPDAKHFDVGGQKDLCLTTDGMIAFVEWSIEKGHVGHVDKAHEFIAYLKSRPTELQP